MITILDYKAKKTAKKEKTRNGLLETHKKYAQSLELLLPPCMRPIAPSSMPPNVSQREIDEIRQQFYGCNKSDVHSFVKRQENFQEKSRKMADSVKAQNLRRKFQRSYVKDLKRIGDMEDIEGNEIKGQLKQVLVRNSNQKDSTSEISEADDSFSSQNEC